ncbi:MAG: hypothetical protein QG641_2723, partial [Candidatus Poribacteria bacterium]|nr:hypothetical protein [Candidatus Poribacteria bacterium]
MKIRILFLLFVFSLILVFQDSYAVSVIKFDKEFGGKGAGSGKFGKILNVAFDANNNIYVSDKENKMIQKLDSDGKFLMQIPKSESVLPLLGGTRNDIMPFNAPGDIAVDSQGNIYVADWGSKYVEGTDNPRLYFFGPCIYKLSVTGTILQTYFIDEFTPKPRMVTPGTFIVDENGKYGWAIQPKEYNRELLVAIDSKGYAYILDIKNNVIHKYDESGKVLLSFGKYGSGKGELDNASDMIIDKENNILVADKGNNRVVKFDSLGNEVLTFGVKGLSDGKFTEPVFIMVTGNNEILVKVS